MEGISRVALTGFASHPDGICLKDGTGGHGKRLDKNRYTETQTCLMPDFLYDT